MNRRSFLGFLGAGGATTALALYADVPLGAEPTPVPSTPAIAPVPVPLGPREFVIVNQGQRVMAIGYRRQHLALDRTDDVGELGRAAPRTSGTLLLPGEELRIVACELQ